MKKSNQNLQHQLGIQPQPPEPLNEIKKHRSWWPCIPPIHPPPPPATTSSTPPPPQLWPVHKLPTTSPVPPHPLLSTNITTTTTHINQNESSPTINKNDEKVDSPLQRRRPYYIGIFLAGPSKTRLLQRYPPLHATVYAHHVTLHHFSGSASIETDVEMCLQKTVPLGTQVAVGVVGGAADERTQALKVTLPTWIPYTRKQHTNNNNENGNNDGKLRNGRSAVVVPHVTVSIVAEASAKEAGEMISSLRASSVEPVHGLRVLHGVVGVCLTDRSVVYSKEELMEALATDDDDDDDDDTALLEEEEDFGYSKVVVGEEAEEEEQDNEEPAVPMMMMINLVDLFHAHFAPLEAAAATAPSEESSPPIISARSNCNSNGLRLWPKTPAASEDHQNKHNSSGHASHLHQPPRSKRNRSRTEETSSGKNRNQNKNAWWQQPPPPSPNTTLIKSNEHVSVQASTSHIDKTTTTTTADPTTTAFLSAAEIERDSMHAHHAAHRAAWHASQASQAQGDGVSSRIHAASAKRHALATVSARRRASAVAFAARNSSNLNSFKLDLHGMHVQEALRVLHRYVQGLNDLCYPGGILLKVVTGYGRHSADNRAKILPSVVAYLCESGFLFDVEEDNPGVVRVLLEPDGLGLL